jgi:hypothetical protein
MPHQGIDVSEVERKLLASEGPKSQATKPDFVKFHDDKVRWASRSHKGLGLAVRAQRLCGCHSHVMLLRAEHIHRGVCQGRPNQRGPAR